MMIRTNQTVQSRCIMFLPASPPSPSHPPPTFPVPFITPKVLDPVVLGTSVNLTCASYSTDTFNLTWSVNGHLLANAVEVKSLTFTVDLVTTDNYTSYTCTSQNTFDMNSTSITLEQAGTSNLC